MHVRDLQLRATKLSTDLFNLFMHFFGSERLFDYHLLHRYASLMNVSSIDRSVYREVLSRLVEREGRSQPGGLSYIIPKLGITSPTRIEATIGAHTRTSKYILKKELNLYALSTQIIGYDFKKKKYSDVECPSELVVCLRDILKMHFGSNFELDLAFDINFDNLLQRIVQQTNYSEPIDNSVLDIPQGHRLSYCVPRPADSINRFIISKIHSESLLRYFGHNLAYTPIFDSDAVEDRFPPLNQEILKYDDDVRSLKRNQILSRLKRKDKILIPLFPFGDTGYSEIGSNHFYQMSLLKELVKIVHKYKEQIVFCLHPGTKYIEQITTMLEGFRVEIGTFDTHLLNAKLIICTYRGTTCFGSSVANNCPTILLHDSGCEPQRRVKNLTICGIEQMTSILEHYK